MCIVAGFRVMMATCIVLVNPPHFVREVTRNGTFCSGLVSVSSRGNAGVKTFLHRGGCQGRAGENGPQGGSMIMTIASRTVVM